jgi:hypothetical protein
MKRQISLKAAGFVLAALAATACASDPVTYPDSGPAAPSAPAPSAPSAPAAFTPALNLAGSSVWSSEERLLPQQPILALIAEGGTINAPVGMSMTCNPDNGVITARLPRQAAGRTGEATFKMKIGTGAAEEIDGRFQVNARTQEADFVFALPSARLTAMSRADVVTFETDTGEVLWAFVKDPAKASEPRAKYVGSLRGAPQEAAEYLVYCNPK